MHILNGSLSLFSSCFFYEPCVFIFTVKNYFYLIYYLHSSFILTSDLSFYWVFLKWRWIWYETWQKSFLIFFAFLHYFLKSVALLEINKAKPTSLIMLTENWAALSETDTELFYFSPIKPRRRRTIDLAVSLLFHWVSREHAGTCCLTMGHLLYWSVVAICNRKVWLDYLVFQIVFALTSVPSEVSWLHQQSQLFIIKVAFCVLI